VHWTVRVANSNVTEKSADGCSPAFSFATNGPRDLSIDMKDSAGGGHGYSYTKRFTVVDPPLNAPPLVSILSPDDHASLDPNTTIQLKAEATDPDNGQPVTGTWSVDGKVIGTGNTRNWKPGDDVPFHCGGNDAVLTFSATDSDGTSTDHVNIHVNYPVC
jgi:hypothetical protein